MSTWSKIDDLRDRVARTSVAEIALGPSHSLRDAQEALDRSGFAPARLVVLGWEIFLSRRRQGGVVRWHLSAKLHPHGRSSTKSDWEVVGRIAARVGAPSDPVFLPDDPRAAVHWSWSES
jgi:hypothetical protein